MYCPKCATQNMENAKFCRACGADISLIPVALTGHLGQSQPAPVEDERPSRRRRRKREKKATYEAAFENIGVGLAFLVISILVALFMPSGRFWWFWLLIPAFACWGEGIGQLVRLRGELPSAATLEEQSQLPPVAAHLHELPSPRRTSEIMAPPPSITEGTTRHLGAEAPLKDPRTPAENSEP